MGSYDVTFLECERCSPEIASFRFAKPDGYGFTAGQYGIYTLETAEGTQSKPFTHSQAPGDQYLEITTRLSGSVYKNALESLRAGDAVSLTGPAGRLTAPEALTRVAFLAGGVGITPVHSILRDRRLRSVAWDDAVLFFGNRDDSCIPYRSEFDAMGDAGLRVVHILERASAAWSGETGYLTAEVVRRHADIADGRLVYVSGPPVMVVAMERVLDELGVAPELRRIERFGPAPAGMPGGGAG